MCVNSRVRLKGQTYPMFILDLALQGSLGKLLRWDPRSRVSIYLGHSPKHTSNVMLVLNISTGHVSPQYQLILNNDFTTVQSMRIVKIPTNWDRLVTTQWDLVTTDVFQLSEEWEDKHANAYPQSNLNIVTWPAEIMAISEEQREKTKRTG